MPPRIAHAEALRPFWLALTFTDGSTGRVDIGPWIAGRGGVFAPLHDAAYFARVQVDADAGTVVWPNGVDLDPDMLYHAAQLTTASAGGTAPPS